MSDMSQMLTADAKTHLSLNLKNEQARKDKAKASHERNVAKLCGEVELTRIIELRRGETQYVHESSMSDEKATRYNSKQSTHLGTCRIVHSVPYT